MMPTSLRLALCGAAAALLLSAAPAAAQRALHWAALDVTAHLDAGGRLRVSEVHTMVFTGDWNGGERVFNIRPRQSLVLDRLAREIDGTWRPLTEDTALDDVDEYAWADERTLRWRSRRVTDPPFAAAARRYEIRYELSGILLARDDGYLLDHDFAFPDRAGDIERYTLRLTFDEAWQPLSDVRERYAVDRLRPGDGFALTVPLRFTGAGVPSTLDTRRPPSVIAAVLVLLGGSLVTVAWLFRREQALGRFAPIPAPVDEAWLTAHVLKYPAEVVGAAWDEHVGPPEVVALIARLVGDGALTSDVDGKSMTLRLNVDRASLDGHARTLVDRLFFDGRSETSTAEVARHYRTTGFDPAAAIRSELEAAVEEVMPGAPGHKWQKPGRLLLILGGALLALEAFVDRIHPGIAAVLAGSAIVLAIAGWITGELFRRSIAWDQSKAALCLIPMGLAVVTAASALWFYIGTGAVETSVSVIAAIVALTLGVAAISVDAMRSRRPPSAVSFRKTLAAGRAFLEAALRGDGGTVRSEWYPWILAFGLGEQADAWSARRPAAVTDRHHPAGAASSSSSSPAWGGFGGGRSGGAGGGASWAAAATGMAARVVPPSSSGSGGSGGSSGGGSSSGGGGGGGW